MFHSIVVHRRVELMTLDRSLVKMPRPKHFYGGLADGHAGLLEDFQMHTKTCFFPARDWQLLQPGPVLQVSLLLGVLKTAASPVTRGLWRRQSCIQGFLVAGEGQVRNLDTRARRLLENRSEAEVPPVYVPGLWSLAGELP